MTNVSGAANRRWPPFAALAVSALMVFLVLPNPLRVPQNNPTASAEYAPVPGRQQAAQAANFGETNAATSAGIGAGGQGEGAMPGQALPPPQRVPRQTDCVGNPPRQTEDPLSPPCVPFWDGDNGGKTFPGVTKDEIKVVFYNDLDVSGDMNTPWQPSDEHTCGTGPYECQYLVRTIKAQLRYFQSRYQTYGRRVRLVAQKSGGITTPCGGRQGDAAVSKMDHEPFASVHLGDGASCYFEAMARDYKIPVFGLNSDVPRSIYENNRPYVWGFFPDQEAESAWSGSFICRVLRGHKAQFAGDANLKTSKRKFGLIYPVNAERGPEMTRLAHLLQDDVKKECGMTFDDTRPFEAGGTAGAGGKEAPTFMAAFKQEGITTVVCYCVPVQTELTVSTMQNAANSVDYHPEWYWDHASRMYRAIWNQTYGDPKQPSFGVNHHWRNPGFHSQFWYQSYRSQEPQTEPNVRFNFDIYHLFLNLFQAIQAAGPRLTPETVEQGMFTFQYQDRDNPYEPMGGYGPYGPKAVSSYNFVDSAMGWWWDPTGTPPEGRAGEGCVRVMNQGRRYYAGEWPIGDKDLFTADAPCSQDDTKLADTAGF
ncbi:MAG: hypothetical protein WDA27_13285 [Actinomycetota bacterium]